MTVSRIVSSVILIMIVHVASAQYDFGNKKFEKLYYKLEEYYEDYDYEGIVDSEQDILGYVEPKSDTLTATIYGFLGEAYYMGFADRRTGLDYYQKELELREKIQSGEDYGRKDLLFNIAGIQDELGEFEASENIYAELIESDRKEYGEKSEEYLNTILSYAKHLVSLQEYNKAKDLFRKHLRSIKKDNELYTFFAHDLGMVYFDQGVYSRAERHLSDASDALEDQGLYASTENVAVLSSYSRLFKQLGKYPEAEEVLREAIDILDQLGGSNEDFYALTYNEIATLYKGLGNFDQAKDYYERVLALDEELYGTEDPTYAVSHSNLASVYIDLEEYAKAEEIYLQTIKTFEEFYGEESADYANNLAQLAFIYRKTGRFDEAISSQQRVVTIIDNLFGDDHPLYAHDVSNFGDIYARINRYSDAEREYMKALNIRKDALGKNHPRYGESTKKMAILKWAQKEYEASENYFKETFDNYFQQIEAYFPILSEEEKAKFYTTKLRPAFEQFNSLAFEGSRESKHLNGVMYDYQLATKGLIMYATNKVRQAIMNSGDSVLINKYTTWIGYKEQLSKLYSTLELEPEERNMLIDSLSSLANDVEKELSSSSKAFANTFTSEKITWKDIQAKLKPGEAAVEIIRYRNFVPDSAGYFNGEVYYAALIVRHDTEDYPDMVLLRSGNDLENRFISYYRNAIKFNIEDQYSYNFFWRPIANRLNDISKVYFSPDGVFNQLSVYTLKNPRTGDYSIDERAIQVMTNTKDLIAYANNQDSSPGDRKAFLFGYPNYNKGRYEQQLQGSSEGGEVRGKSRGARGSRSGGGSNTRGTRGGISRGLRGNLQRYIDDNSLLALLPGTKREVELIQDLYTNNQSEPITYLENQAIETNLKKVDNPHTLHIATHGFFLENDDNVEEGDDYVQNPLLRSGLIFAGANSFLSSGDFLEDEDAGQDGILTAFEAMNMNLDDTELVVMSACETGLGEVTNGEGVYGLQRSFQIAGAKSIIMSLWTVDDDATQELMTNFYSEWLKSGDKPSAFIAAQQKLREKYEQPYYWGAFVMVGQ